MMNSDLLYIIYMMGKRGVTIGNRAGRSVRPSSWVVSVVWRLNNVVVFSYCWILSSCFLIIVRYVVNREWSTISRTKIFKVGESWNALFLLFIYLSSLLSFCIFLFE